MPHRKPTFWEKYPLWVGLAALLATLLGCFEDRIEEVLTIGIDQNGGGTFHYAVSLHDIDPNRVRVEERVQQFKQSLEDGSAPWIRAFNATPNVSLIGSEIRKEDDSVSSFSAWVQTTSIEEALPELFLDTPVQISVDREVGSLGITLFPGPAQGGNRSQRRRMEDTIKAWSVAIPDYLETVAALWEYIEATPSRRTAILDSMFVELGLAQGREEPNLSDQEETMVERYEKAETAVAEIFETPRGAAYTAQELSRLIYDPYPLQVLLTLTDDEGRAFYRKPDLVEGLEEYEKFAWRVPRTSLWDTFTRLEGQWIFPDPLLAKVAFTLKTQDKDDFDVDSFSQQEFSVLQVPSTGTVHREILQGLRPPDISTILWVPNDQSSAAHANPP